MTRHPRAEKKSKRPATPKTGMGKIKDEELLERRKQAIEEHDEKVAQFAEMAKDETLELYATKKLREYWLNDDFVLACIKARKERP